MLSSLKGAQYGKHKIHSMELAVKNRDLALFNLAIDGTVRYLGVEVEDPLALAERIEL